MNNKVKIQASEPFDTAFELSIKELAEANNLDYLEAQGFIKTLVKLKLAKMGAARKVEGQKGKPTNIYLIPTEFSFKLIEQVAAKPVEAPPQPAPVEAAPESVPEVPASPETPVVEAAPEAVQAEAA